LPEPGNQKDIMNHHNIKTPPAGRDLNRSGPAAVLRKSWGVVVACAVTLSFGAPALAADPLTIELGKAVKIEGKLFAQKFHTSADDPKFKGETAFLPIIVSEQKLAFKFSAIDQGFLPGPAPAGPVDRIELSFKDPLLLEKHEKSEGKAARIQGSLIIDQDNRLLPVKFEVSKLEILEPAGKPKPASPEPGTQPRKDIREFWKVAAPQWQAGPITKLDEEEVDGTVQTHTLTSQAMITEIREAGESGYTITHKLISKKDKALLAVHEISWTNDPWKLTETVFEFGSPPARKHYKEQEMKQHFLKMNSKPKSVAGSYATEKLDEKGVATLKEERADWWAGGLK
jgi:hypothetical protein